MGKSAPQLVPQRGVNVGGVRVGGGGSGRQGPL